MKILTAIWEGIKSFFGAIKKAVGDKPLPEVVADVSKAITSAAAAALIIYSTVNVVRNRFMAGNKKKPKNDDISPAEYLMRQRKDGSVDARLEDLRRRTQNFGKKYVKENANLDKEGTALLNRIAKTRNSVFNSLTQTEQIDVLRLEGFDCEVFLYEEQKKLKNTRSLFGKKKDDVFLKPGYINGDKVRLISENQFLTFRDKVRRFFLLPTEDKVPQIVLFPNGYEPPVTHEELEELQTCGSVALKYMPHSNIDRYLRPNMEAQQIIDRRQDIILDEAANSKSYKKFCKRVKKRMKTEGLSSVSVYELMKAEEKRKKKKKKKKDNDDRDISPFSFYDDEEPWLESDKKKKKKKKDKKKGKKNKDSSSGKKDKKKKKKNKDDGAISEKYVKDAKATYAHFLKYARAGREDYIGIW
jgi:hypothetical protein